jgi:hypothetical protein
MSVTYGGDKITFDDGTSIASGYTLFRNRIINGAMMIDQRNAGASVTGNNGTFGVDRWATETSEASKLSMQQDAGAVTPPVGFTDYLGLTSSSAYTVTSGQTFNLYQRIEGLNITDLAWGTANAKTVTLSFWVRSSLTGTFGGAIQNNGNDRSYPFTFTINSANTWEYETVTIPGDTTGTWLTNNGIGIRVRFNLGAGSSISGTAGVWSSSDFRSATGATSVVGTNGATFYLTGVQLEVGSFATTFERRPYTTELQLCQRYYYKLKGTAGGQYFAASFNESTTQANGTVFFPVTMRTNPTALEQSGTAGDYSVGHGTTATTCSSVPSFGAALDGTARVAFITSGGLTAGQGSALRVQTSSAFLAWSAEL